MTRTTGFTLIELMVTLAIAAILAVVAAPSLSTFLENGRAFRGANVIASAVRFARAEAVNLQSPVVICGRNDDGSNCSNSNDWRSGLLVFVDNNRNGSHDNDERVLKSTAAFDQQDQVQASLIRLTLTPEGRSQNMQSLLVRYCPTSASSSLNRAVTVSGAGRVATSKGVALAGSCSSS